ncbi:OmpA family protein [Acinetobacter larvae]|uniref:OmpA-like domain-containing protein n=1 Tax=Acinetobacter larvae TaxID=1789224 RepID=A0A1B2M4G5_9GAMM|nr:OmpA family protein [Acinetobacter larvae]AOA60003.1 hypothetical protein BFG52_13440 [Acinetobacter larvae]
MLSKSFKFFTIIFMAVALNACMNLGNLSYKQARVLKKEGFVLTDEGWTLALPERLLFDFDSFDITADKQNELTHLANQLHKYNLNKLKVVGHTDDLGEANYNQKLSEKRAQRVAQIFLEQGFNNNNIHIIGRGSKQPLVVNDSDKNRAINRRVNIVIIP